MVGPGLFVPCSNPKIRFVLCAWARDRTGDLSLFRTALYQLSYPSIEKTLYHDQFCFNTLNKTH